MVQQHAVNADGDELLWRAGQHQKLQKIKKPNKNITIAFGSTSCL
jgi:uncharacterized protein (DUF1330 family)